VACGDGACIYVELRGLQPGRFKGWVVVSGRQTEIVPDLEITPMPGSIISAFTDPLEYQAFIRAADVKVLVTAPGNYEAELTRVDLHQVWMQRSVEKLPRITFAAVHPDRHPLFFLLDADQRNIHHTGREVSPGTIVAYAPAAEHHHRSGGPCRWGAMSLTSEALAEIGRTLVGHDLKPPAATHLIRPDPAAMSRLLQLHEAAGKLAVTAPDILAHPEVAKALEQQLVRAMVTCLTDPGKVERTGRLPVIRRFERLLEEKEGWPIYLGELCAAIGVTGRTLRAHCQEHLGMSPHRYLWLRRMNLAHRVLVGAEPGSMTVTTIANDQGFAELGRFAGDYRKLFGEAPSATLRRPADIRTA
jgi:AraC-like DNA-binding protein